MAHPKRKTSKARKRKRRAHDALSVPNLTPCPRCGQPRMSHRVCGNCGHYKGEQVVSV